LAEFGNSFGFAFQIKDDLDDYINGNEFQNRQEKMTWVSVNGITQSQLDLEGHVQKCRFILNDLKADYDTSFFKNLLDKFFKID
jgi:geranylgeranyl pyrophosphate synthase